jgi:hypothetical protein
MGLSSASLALPILGWLPSSAGEIHPPCLPWPREDGRYYKTHPATLLRSGKSVLFHAK